MDYVLVSGHGLFGKDHAVWVPLLRGEPVVPRRSKKALCGIRVQVTSSNFINGPQACQICNALQLLPREST